MTPLQEYQRWMSRIPEESALYKELELIKGNEQEITERFYQDIEFGTAGLRGICAAGRNRMNEYTVGRATQGLANYILESGEDIDKGVVVAYDCRYFSKEFSELAVEILAANGIHCYIFPSLRATPELAYTIRRLGTVSGINMTASHNPKEYNGYKVYWKDGAQISSDVSDGIQAEIMRLDFFDSVKRMKFDDAVTEKLVTILGEEIDEEYLDYVISLAKRNGEELDDEIPVVYTPLNGAGSIPMKEIAKKREFRNFHIVQEQEHPDPDFTTVPFPNPENPAAFALAEKLGKEKGAEVLIATDPDADRMAIEIADGKGGYLPLNGNQTGGLLIAYLAESEKEKHTLSAKSAMIKSIVTGDFGRAVCEDYGIRVVETLTGFKNICGKIPELEKEGYDYFFGYEESIGCAPGEKVRDKDGIAAGMLVMEMAAWLRRQGKTIASYLEELYQKYGYFHESQVSVVLQGKEGQQEIKEIMKRLRCGETDSFGEFKVKERIDYKDGYEDIPPQNALKFIMTDGSWFAARPSGTEPKIKFYFYTWDRDAEVSAERLKALERAVKE